MNVTTLCLGALFFGKATGYEINKMFEDGPFSHFLDASYGSIYPALTRLTEEGKVTCEAAPQDGRPDKKIYSLTEKGFQSFREALQASIAPDKYRSEFLFVTLYAHILPRSYLGEIVDRRLHDLREEARLLAHSSEHSSDDDPPGANFARRYGLAVIEASIAFLENNRHLVEDVAVEDGVGSPLAIIERP